LDRDEYSSSRTVKESTYTLRSWNISANRQ
jgi:hypothetical protein